MSVSEANQGKMDATHGQSSSIVFEWHELRRLALDMDKNRENRSPMINEKME